MSILYGLDSRPPLRVMLPAALQHIGLGAVTLVFPLLVAEAAGADAPTTARYLSLAMIALGIATILQGLGRWGIGSGFLLPSVFTAIFLPPALGAAREGGLGAVAGLTMVAGVTGMLLSRVIERIRGFLPAEIIGLVVMVLGIVLGLLSLRLVLGVDEVGTGGTRNLPAGIVALLVTVGVAVWGSARLRSIAVLIGLGAGCAAHLALLATGLAADGPGPAMHVATLSWPLAAPSLSLIYLPGFLIGALAAAVRVMGDVVASQRANDPAWKRTDFGGVRRGMMADGLGNLIAGAIGVIGTNSYSASVGLAAATGITARRVGIATGIGWILLGLMPGAASLVMAVPRGVLGAVLLYAASYILMSGMTIITQRLLDARRTLTIGVALLIALSYSEIPGLYAALPDYVRMTIGSGLVLGMAAALTLHAIFRIGATQIAEWRWDPDSGAKPLVEFVTEKGRICGARAEVVGKAAHLLEEFADAAPMVMAPGSTALVRVRFDELRLDIDLAWEGEAMAAGAAVDLDADIEAAGFVSGLAMMLMRHHADRLEVTRLPDGRHGLAATIDDR
ncbi:xanthine permease [Roseomonas sp. HJA6]|uniref:Xanthine permease n=1 Tax=Roseomonas alba TaxID=2846776 RepID=A0ABS7A7F4_9PROT|nr:solute carrier family 23 protein [Neoroseomonas alba]MBW6398231.1 xanthine permease [Neoroseomonas alba]